MLEKAKKKQISFDLFSKVKKPKVLKKARNYQIWRQKSHTGSGNTAGYLFLPRTIESIVLTRLQYATTSSYTVQPVTTQICEIRQIVPYFNVLAMIKHTWSFLRVVCQECCMSMCIQLCG